MGETQVNTRKRIDRLAMVTGPLTVLGLVMWFAGWTGPNRSHAGADAAWVLLTSAPWAIGWLAAAIGFGWPLRRLLVRDTHDGLAIQLGLGIAAMLTLDAGLGALGVLQWGGSVGAWVLLLAGIGLLAEQLRRWRNTAERAVPLIPWPTWTAAPAIAVLLLAACSAPGWLWASEFGGYDALSYHLQLPKEWLALGRIEPLEHNVYSYLPGYVEAAYYHLAVLIGDGIGAVYACQLLHAGFTVLTAAVVGRLAARFGGPIVGAAAAVVVLGTPWVIVVGSLGYNEMAVALMLATGLLIVGECRNDSWRLGAVLGITAAAACGAKLTSAGFVAVPLALLMLAMVPPRRWARHLIAATLAGLIVLLPYLVRNWVYVGNPIFPFAAEFLGHGHWTAEQAGIWMRGHITDATLGGRLGEMWNQLLRYGIGSNPDPSQPWQPQWSVLPWLALIGAAVALLSRRRRWLALRILLVIAIQIAFWLWFTHIKSRFMLPMVVPAALGVGIGLAAAIDRMRSANKDTFIAAFVCAVTLAWCCLPALVFLRERGGAPAAMVGWADVMTGDALTDNQRAEAADSFPTVYLNHLITRQARVLFMGETRALAYRGHIAYQSTWDRGPMSDMMRLYPKSPKRWLAALRERGYTHMLVNTEMLELWADEGWNDPLITADRVINAAGRYAHVEQSWGDGRLTLYQLTPSASR